MSTPISFDTRLCDRNPYCPAVRSCPTGAMHIDRKNLSPSFDGSKCTRCGTCLSSCPRGALTLA